jgi:hypothetical protein
VYVAGFWAVAHSVSKRRIREKMCFMGVKFRSLNYK